jgi:hypothetical protein
VVFSRKFTSPEAASSPKLGSIIPPSTFLHP